MKIVLIILLILIIICVIMAIVIKTQNSKNKELKNKLNDYKNEYFELNDRFEKLLEEMQIEKNHNQELAKKLADISCMSIDDVMHQL